MQKLFLSGHIISLTAFLELQASMIVRCIMHFVVIGLLELGYSTRQKKIIETYPSSFLWRARKKWLQSFSVQHPSFPLLPSSMEILRKSLWEITWANGTRTVNLKHTYSHRLAMSGLSYSFILWTLHSSVRPKYWHSMIGEWLSLMLTAHAHLNLNNELAGIHEFENDCPWFGTGYFPKTTCWEWRIGVSTDSQYSHLAWATQTRRKGGLGPDLHLPLIADRNMSIARNYGVLIEDEGIALRGLFIIDPKGILR